MTTLNVNVVSSNGRSLVTVVGSGPAGVAGAGVPSGGTAGQALTKIDATAFNTQWTSVAIPTAWTAPSGFTNGWVNFGGAEQNAQYRKIGDVVYIRGVIKTGTVGLVAFNLPAGFRPPAPLGFAITSNGAMGTLVVSLNGDIVPLSGSNVSFHLNVAFSIT